MYIFNKFLKGLNKIHVFQTITETLIELLTLEKQH